MAAPSLPCTPPPCQLSFSRFVVIPQTCPFLRLNSRFVILHARNVNSDPWRFGEDDDDDDNVVFIRRRRRKTRGNGRRSTKPRWWSDDNQEEEEEEGGILQQLVDNLWILQVFKAYGFFLPIILISLLISTGPKAFIMGSGIPFGLSLLAFAFTKFSEMLNSALTSRPIPKYKQTSSLFDGRQQETRQGEKNKKRNYRTRVDSFGGWDALVTEDETETTVKSSGTKERFEMMTGKKLGSSIDEK